MEREREGVGNQPQRKWENKGEKGVFPWNRIKIHLNNDVHVKLPLIQAKGSVEGSSLVVIQVHSDINLGSNEGIGELNKPSGGESQGWVSRDLTERQKNLPQSLVFQSVR